MNRKFVPIICLSLLLILLSCKKEVKNYKVKYSATYDGYWMGSFYWYRLQYRVKDSLLKVPTIELANNKSWSYEFDGEIHDTLQVIFTSYQGNNEAGHNLISIYLNDKIVSQNPDSSSYVIK